MYAACRDGGGRVGGARRHKKGMILVKRCSLDSGSLATPSRSVGGNWMDGSRSRSSMGGGRQRD